MPVSSPMTYTLTVNNLGAANATGVKVVDTLPLGLLERVVFDHQPVRLHR